MKNFNKSIKNNTNLKIKNLSRYININGLELYWMKLIG